MMVWDDVKNTFSFRLGHQYFNLFYPIGSSWLIKPNMDNNNKIYFKQDVKSINVEKL